MSASPIDLRSSARAALEEMSQFFQTQVKPHLLEAGLPYQSVEEAYEASLSYLQEKLGIGRESAGNLLYRANLFTQADLGLQFGENPAEMDPSQKMILRRSGDHFRFLEARVTALQQLKQLFESSPSTAHMQNGFRLFTNLYQEITGSSESIPPQYIEAREAAKTAIDRLSDPQQKAQLLAQLQSDKLAFVHNPQIRQLTIDEINSRLTALTTIQALGPTYSNQGFLGRLADFGILRSLFISSTPAFAVSTGLWARNKLFSKAADAQKWGPFKLFSRDLAHSRARMAFNGSNPLTRWLGGSYSSDMAKALGFGDSAIDAAFKQHSGLKNVNIDRVRSLFAEGKIGKHKPFKINWGDGRGHIKYKNFDDFYAAAVKACVHHGKSDLIKYQPAAAKSILWKARGKAISKQLVRKAPWILALTAAASWAYNALTGSREDSKIDQDAQKFLQESQAPQTSEPAPTQTQPSTGPGTPESSQSPGYVASTGRFLRDMFAVDLGILTNGVEDSWFQEEHEGVAVA